MIGDNDLLTPPNEGAILHAITYTSIIVLEIEKKNISKRSRAPDNCYCIHLIKMCFIWSAAHYLYMCNRDRVSKLWNCFCSFFSVLLFCIFLVCQKPMVR